jgi:flagellar motor protein MotB
MSEENPPPVILVRKKAGGHAHHSGAWKVAYADFVTAMMALFIVLWLMNTSEQIRKAISAYFRDPYRRRPACWKRQRRHRRNSLHRQRQHGPLEGKSRAGSQKKPGIRKAQRLRLNERYRRWPARRAA